jgi:hypothetical protein
LAGESKHNFYYLLLKGKRQQNGVSAGVMARIGLV